MGDPHASQFPEEGTEYDYHHIYIDVDQSGKLVCKYLSGKAISIQSNESFIYVRTEVEGDPRRYGHNERIHLRKEKLNTPDARGDTMMGYGGNLICTPGMYTNEKAKQLLVEALRILIDKHLEDVAADIKEHRLALD